VSAPDPLRLGPVPAPIQRAYDSERFRADGHRLVDALADLLAAAHARAGRVLPWQAPAAGRAAIPDLVGAGADGGHDAIADLAALAAGSIQLHHPHAVGHQVAPPLPVAALAELVAATVNNGMAVYEMGPTAVPVEDVVIDWMLAQAGLPTRAHGGGGVLTSGGSLGNLTALLAARQASVARAAATGADPAAAPTLLSAAEAHYSVARAVAVMGWGAAGLTLVGTDRARRLDPDLTRRAGLARTRRRPAPGRAGGVGRLDRDRRVRFRSTSWPTSRPSWAAGCTSTAPTAPAWRCRPSTGTWCVACTGPTRWCGTRTSC
jgi:L-2,4-diaminobutyrate decarboxylase